MAVICSNPECNISETGKCVEGFSPVDDCPTYGSEIDDLAVEVVDSSPLEETIESDVISLSSGNVLDDKQTDSLLKQYSGQVIACIGPSDIGKTTLLASIYEVFNKGNAINYSFGGSKTLYAFEEICHHSRAASHNKQADMIRTVRKNAASFYHIALNSLNKSARVDLFLADRAGEEYEDAVNNSDDCSGLYEVLRADMLMILIDGRALSDNKDRHAAKSHAESLVRALQDEGMFTTGMEVKIIMTRYDLAFIKDSAEKALGELSKVTQKIKGIVAGLNVNVTSHVVAARPNDITNAEIGHGVPELIEMMAIKSSFKVNSEPSEVITGPRSFHRFGIE